MSLFEIKCPMCKGTIWIDPSSGRLIDHKSADHKKLDLQDFMKSEKNKSSELEGKLIKAKEEHEKRKLQLEEDFKHAKEHPEDLEGEEYQSPFQWD